SLGHEALRDEITFAADGLEDLVEVGVLGRGNLEDVLAARALQGFEDNALGLAFDEGADFLDAFGNQRFGANRGWEILEIELVLRLGEAFGIVEDENATLGRHAPEDDADIGGPWPVGRVF